MDERCARCADSSKSRVALAHFVAAQKEFGDARSGVKRSGEVFSHAWTVDITAVSHGRNIVIEYDGAYWHRGNVEQDLRESQELLAAGSVVVRLRKNDPPSLSIDSSNYLEVSVASQTPRPEETMGRLSLTLEAFESASLW